MTSGNRLFTLGLMLCSFVTVGRVFGQQSPKGKSFFELGTVIKADGGTFNVNAIPCVSVTPGGKLITVWTAPYGGLHSKMRVVGALSPDGGHTWSAPFTLIDNPGKEDADPNVVIDEKRILVLSTTLPVPGKILTTEIWMTASEDEGKTWRKPVLTTHPHKYNEGKVHVGYKLKDGRLAVGYAWDIFCERGLSPATEGEMDNRAGLMFSSDGGVHWTAGGDIYARPPKVAPWAVNGMDEPATVVLENGEIFALLRNATTHLYQSRSKDNGASWSALVPSPLTSLNAPAALWRLRGSKDVVVVWDNSPQNRWPLEAAISEDSCSTWSKPKVIVDPGMQASYPSVTQAADGTIVAVWQQQLSKNKEREIRLARFNRAWLLSH
jgi:predicted neuraminidase